MSEYSSQTYFSKIVPKVALSMAVCSKSFENINMRKDRRSAWNDTHEYTLTYTRTHTYTYITPVGDQFLKNT